jgi:hypothetical protein
MSPDEQLSADTLRVSFKAHWPFLESVIVAARTILKGSDLPAPVQRSVPDMFDEIVSLLREIQRSRARPSAPTGLTIRGFAPTVLQSKLLEGNASLTPNALSPTVPAHMHVLNDDDENS